MNVDKGPAKVLYLSYEPAKELSRMGVLPSLLRGLPRWEPWIEGRQWNENPLWNEMGLEFSDLPTSIVFYCIH